jgi:hypothetical protein
MDGTGRRRGARRTAAETPSTARQGDGERRPVDIDPWAVLLEQLTEVPEEGVPAERKGGKRE